MNNNFIASIVNGDLDKAKEDIFASLSQLASERLQERKIEIAEDFFGK